MTDRDALIAAIAAAPDDDLPRLVFADWLEENGDPAQAAFIRKQIEFVRHGGGEPRRSRSEEVKAIAVREAAGWVAPLCEAFGQPPPRWPPDPSGNWFARLWKAPAVADALHLRPYLHDDGELAVPCAVCDGKGRGAVPLGLVRFRRGMIERLVVTSQHVRDGTGFETAFRTTPVSGLSLELSNDPDAWLRGDGPWFAGLGTLVLGPPATTFGRARPAYRPAFRSPHLIGLRTLTLVPAVCPESGGSLVDYGVIMDLAASPLAGLLRVIRVPLIPQVIPGFRDYPARGPLEELCPAALSGGMGMTPEDWRSLADLPFRPSLKRLSLRACSLTDAGLTALCRGPRWDALVALRLDANPLTDSGGVAFARLVPFPKLQALRLDRCQLADDTARALARSPLVHTLQTLDLSHNRVTADGALPLAVAYAEGPLRRLRLAGNPISRRRRHRIRDILRDRVVLDP
jgi:uncharacterized protein (TIGR02996 family)